MSEANRIAFEKLIGARPVLDGCRKAGEAIPGFKRNLILHSGPPVEYKNMRGPHRMGVVGAAIFEGRRAEFWKRGADEFVEFQRVAQFFRSDVKHAAGEGGTELFDVEVSADMVAVRVRAEQNSEILKLQSFFCECGDKDGVDDFRGSPGVDENIFVCAADQHNAAPRSAERSLQQ